MGITILRYSENAKDNIQYNVFYRWNKVVEGCITKEVKSFINNLCNFISFKEVKEAHDILFHKKTSFLSKISNIRWTKIYVKKYA
jgi:hypothetical protein